MIEKRVVPYWEIDEYSDLYTRMITAVIQEAVKNAEKVKPPKPPKGKRYWWPYDELVPPVVSPERPY